MMIPFPRKKADQMSDEDTVAGHDRAVAADQAAILEHELAADDEQMAAARAGIAAVLGEAVAEASFPRREPNPYVGEFDGSRPQSEELRDRVRAAMEKAMRLEAEGRSSFSLVVPGPESLYSLSMACHAAAFFPEFRKDPRALEVVTGIGQDIGNALAEFPGHGASLRPLGQMLQAMWEAYARLGPEALLSRYSEQGHAHGPVKGAHDHEGPMPAVAFEAMACALRAASDAAGALAGYEWHDHRDEPGPEPGPEERPDWARTIREQSQAHRVGAQLAPGDRRLSVPADWVPPVDAGAFPAETDSVVFVPPQQAGGWFDQTPVADAVAVDLSETQLIPPPAGDVVTEPDGHILSAFAGHESWRCARCAGILHGVPKGMAREKLAAHQADPELCLV